MNHACSVPQCTDLTWSGSTRPVDDKDDKDDKDDEEWTKFRLFRFLPLPRLDDEDDEDDDEGTGTGAVEAYSSVHC